MLLAFIDCKSNFFVFMGLWGLTIFYYVFIIGLISFIFFHYHYLFLLLSIELMMLALYFMYTFSFYFSLGGLSIFLVYLVLMVCGAVFGISLLINYVRLTGIEMFSIKL